METASAEGIRAALMRGLPRARRFEWVQHLAGLCPERLAVLERCAGQAKAWETCGGRLRQTDVVLCALVRLLETIRDGLSAELEDVSPSLWLALRDARRVPLGFCRLIVEESLFQARRRVEEAVDLVEEGLCAVSRSELAVHGPKLHRDLIIRAQAYLGEAFRMSGQHLEAERGFANAERELRFSSGDRELEATLWELRATLARDQNDPVRSSQLLEKAVSLLDSSDLERRLAEVLIAKGNRLSEQGDSAGARKDYLEAMELLPMERYPRLRLKAEHNLAVDQSQNGELRAAYQRFTQAAPLYEQYGDALIKAQRHWVLATIHLRSGNWNDAEKMLRAALGAYFDFGYGYDVVRILLDLGSVYLAQGRERKLNRVLTRLHALTRQGEEQEFLLAELHKFHEVARGSKAAAELSTMIAELELRAETPPN